MDPKRCSAWHEDNPCLQPAEISNPVPLCKHHCLGMATVLLPRFMKDVLNAMQSAAVEEGSDWENLMDLTDSARSVSPEAVIAAGTHDPMVYVISNGPRIKIGLTRNLRSRVAALSLRAEDIMCVLRGDRELERAMHRRFFADRVGTTEWFDPGEELLAYVKRKIVEVEVPGPSQAQLPPQMERPTVPVRPLQRYPDGQALDLKEWPDLYRVFCKLCEEQGHATKEDLVENGPFASRDTVRRAVDVWLQHGVQVRKAGRAEQFYLPDNDTE